MFLNIRYLLANYSSSLLAANAPAAESISGFFKGNFHHYTFLIDQFFDSNKTQNKKKKDIRKLFYLITMDFYNCRQKPELDFQQNIRRICSKF